MSSGKHYSIERNAEGKFAVRSNDAKHTSGVFQTQNEATAHAKKLNTADRPDVERVRRTPGGSPDKRRPA